MKGLVRMILAVAMGLGIAGSANATPITYTFSGFVGGQACVLCDGSPGDIVSSGASDFTLVINSDTTAVDASGDPYFRVDNVSGLFTAGGFSTTLTGIIIVVNSDPAFERINFFSNDASNGLGLANNAALNGYGLTSSIGPISDTDPGAFLNPTFTPGGKFTTTDGFFVQLTSNRSLTFTAAVADATVPEPATFALVGAGLAFVALRRRRSAQ